MKKNLIAFRTLYFCACFLPIVFLTSCSVFDWFMGKTSDEEVDELDKDLGTPDKRATAYDKSLIDFGDLLEAYNITPSKLQCKPIKNLTAEKGLPDDISKMVATAINKIGRNVIYIPYDPTYVISEATTGGNINRTLPDMVIDGGLNEFDKDMIEKQREAKAEAQIKKGDWGSKYDYDGGAGYEAKSGVSRLGLDLHLLDYKSQAAIAGKQVSNTINIRKTQLGWSIGAYFQGCGLSFDYSLKKQQGIHSAIRLLVELSVLELLGKSSDVPYWRCIQGADPDNAMCARMLDEFNDLDDARQTAYLKEYLFLHGYDGLELSKNFFSEPEKQSLNGAMSKLGATGKSDLFLKLWQAVPIEEAKKRLKEYRKNLEQQLQTQLETQKQAQIEAQRKTQSEVQNQPQSPPQQPQQTQPAQVQSDAASEKTAQKTDAVTPKGGEKEKPAGIGSVKEW